MTQPEKQPETLLNASAMADGIEALAKQIIAAGPWINPAFVGIRTRGVVLAERLRKRIDPEMPLGILDITLYRDDLAQQAAPLIRNTQIDFDLEGRSIFLVDDVLFTGRTIRAAMTALADLGRAHSIRLVSLVDRGHRELPIQADFCYRKIDTTYQDRVHVHFTETDDRDETILIRALDLTLPKKG